MPYSINWLDFKARSFGIIDRPALGLQFSPRHQPTMPLDQLPIDARPREKLLARGPQALADAELLALLLRTGGKGQPVLHLARAMLDHLVVGDGEVISLAERGLV